MLNSLNFDDIETRSQVQLQLSTMLNEGSIKNQLQESFSFYSDSSVYVGQTSTRNEKDSFGMDYDAECTYTLKSVKNNIAEIIVNSHWKSGSSGITNLINGKATMSGENNGIFKIDLAHLKAHGGNFKNKSTGTFINRKLDAAFN